MDASAGTPAAKSIEEVVFSYPGMGFLLQKAILQHDFPVMQTILLMLTLLMIAANFIADITYGLLDPRTREV